MSWFGLVVGVCANLLRSIDLVDLLVLRNSGYKEFTQFIQAVRSLFSQTNILYSTILDYGVF